MEEGARWVCNTCKTVCSRGGRLLLHNIRNKDDVIAAMSHLGQASTFVRIENYSDIVSFSDDLRKWLSCHEAHNIHIGSDYSTDNSDLDDYYNESVDGKKSDATRLELQTRSWEDWHRVQVDKIKAIMLKNASRTPAGVMIDADTAAEEIFGTTFLKFEQGGKHK